VAFERCRRNLDARATEVKGGCLDLAARPGADGDYLFVSCGTFEQATVYRAKNAESTSAWEAVLTEPNMGRTTLAIAPSNPSVVYALSASNEPGASSYQGLLALFRSDQDGDSGSWQARIRNTTSDHGKWLLTNPISASVSKCEPGASDFVTTMGWYCNTIAVDPVDANRVGAGGVDLFRSDDGGQSWGVVSYWWADPAKASSFVHADQHAIVFHPQYDGSTNKTLFVANDGGVARTEDALAAPARDTFALCEPKSLFAFTSLNHNYGATQFYHGAVFPDGKSFIAGAQDNGTLIGRTETGTDGWQRVFGGDGGYPAVDPQDPKHVYVQSQVANIARSIDGGATFTNGKTGLAGSIRTNPPVSGPAATACGAPTITQNSGSRRAPCSPEPPLRSLLRRAIPIVFSPERTMARSFGRIVLRRPARRPSGLPPSRVMGS
jgi:hypothetical protein